MYLKDYTIISNLSYINCLIQLNNLIIYKNANKLDFRAQNPNNTLISIYKNKGDIQSYTNYHGIKLMSHTIKFWERVIEHRLRHEITILTNQFGFMPGRTTIQIFI